MSSFWALAHGLDSCLLHLSFFTQKFAISLSEKVFTFFQSCLFLHTISLLLPVSYSFLTPGFPTFQPSVTPCHYPPELLIRGQVFRQDRITQSATGPGCMCPLAESAVCPGHLSMCVASVQNFSSTKN